MCALRRRSIILLACGGAGLRAVSLQTEQLAAHEPNAIREVYGVAFDAHIVTLLLLVVAPTGGYDQLVSLRRNASEWLEVHGYGRTLYVFDVSAERTLLDAGSVTLQSQFYGVAACTRREGITVFAFSHGISVSLLRLTSLPLRLVPLASVSLADPHRLLFREDLLLVADWNRATGTDAIVSFRASDNGLTERRVLLDAGVDVYAWALASDRLVLWNWKSEELLVYAFT